MAQTSAPQTEFTPGDAPVLQTTIADRATVAGVGLHSGHPVCMTLAPAAADSGITFIRTDLDNAEVPALWDRVTDTMLCTRITGDEGVDVGTVEHLMAALAGCRIDNLRIELDGPEVPIMDGSSEAFVQLIDQTGVQMLSAERRAIKILKAIEIEQDGKLARLEPADRFELNFEIDFDHAAIGRQSRGLTFVNGAFKSQISRARTFGFLHEVEHLQKLGLARGGSLDNAIVVDKNGVMNDDGLRFDDEFVRHKILDSVGDLYLAGAPILGRFHGVRAGHALNNSLLRALFADPEAWEYVPLAGSSDYAVERKAAE
ncbi:MAG: UDP-3-O-acyl-N-acetylglucosamine deacetylase [Rhodospirillales bacterium]